MKTRLFATDMDGTLLTDLDKSFDAELLDKVLKKLEEKGDYFVIATGNQYPKALEYLEGFLDRGIYFIAENGAYIADGKQDMLISGFSEDTVREVIEALENFPEIGVVFSTHEGAFLPLSRVPVVTRIVQEHLEYLGADFHKGMDYMDFIQRFYPGTQSIDSYEVLAGKTVVKFALQTNRADTASIVSRLIDKLPANVVPVQSGFGSIDLISRGVNKGSALMWLSEKLGVQHEEIMAFGDASNDLEMINLAGVGVAMGNAVPAVKAAADLVIGNNNDGAVLKYIEQVLDQEQA